VPELPDIDVYIDKLDERINGRILKQIRVATPFLLRSVDPPLSHAIDKRVSGLRRVGKRIAIGLEGDYWLILHLMIAGRLQWHDIRPALSGRNRLALFDFSNGSLSLTEAGSKRRASLYLVQGRESLDAHDPGGIEPLICSFEEFAWQLTIANRTLKRVLTDPSRFSGIGNAYSDEILHAARLSPIALSCKLNTAEQKRLYDAMRTVLHQWRERLLAETGNNFPSKVSAFRNGMSVHGQFGKACPVCGATVQRIRYKNNETNYCPRCQTGSKLLADRALSRLLKADWPDRIED